MKELRGNAPVDVHLEVHNLKGEVRFVTCRCAPRASGRSGGTGLAPGGPSLGSSRCRRTRPCPPLIGTVLNLRTTTLHKCAAVPRRARI